MLPYEFEVVEIGDDAPTDKWNKVLNARAKKGWEFVSAARRASSSVLIFRREREGAGEGPEPGKAMVTLVPR